MEMMQEQILALQHRGNVPYEVAKEALTASEGNLLDALISLECGGFYTTKSQTTDDDTPHTHTHTDDEGGSQQESPRFRAPIQKVSRSFARQVFDTRIAVMQEERILFQVPVLIVVVLMVVVLKLMVVLLLAGVLLGYQYQFTGGGTGQEAVNDVIAQGTKRIHRWTAWLRGKKEEG